MPKTYYIDNPGNKYIEDTKADVTKRELLKEIARCQDLLDIKAVLRKVVEYAGK